MSNKYRLIVRDMLESDEDKSFNKRREYGSAEEAIEAAKDIIDDYIVEDYAMNPKDSPFRLIDSFLDFGYMPYVIGPTIDSVSFNARTYAQARCFEVCGQPVPECSVYGEQLMPTGRANREVINAEC
jgi:hypothetical protein